MSRNDDSVQVRVIYDFQAQPGTGELNIYTNEILTVTRKDVGEGWWEGVNNRGESGLFPAGYVEIVPKFISSSLAQSTSSSNVPTSPPLPSFPPPPAPAGTDPYDAGDADWGDDDWDDDDDSQTSTTAGDNAPSGSYPHTSGSSQPYNNFVISGDRLGERKASQSAPVQKSFNRFSYFVKSGEEDFILGLKTKQVPSELFNYIVETADGDIMWSPNLREYTCSVSTPRKETKLKGLKSYMAYQLTPSFNNIVVSRRYKHFDWLHGRLENKFITIPIPALPAKQISGRFEEEFIEHRKIQLQNWVNRICRHPVISQCDVWKHFITCIADEKRWKMGKRKAEKDEFTGAAFFYTLQPPNVPLEVSFVESKTESFGKFIVKMDDAVKFLSHLAQDQCKKYTGPYKREMQKISLAFNSLANSFDQSDVRDTSLNAAIKGTASIYESVAKLYEEEPRHDFEPLSYILHEYKGILSAWPSILDINKGSLNKKKEYIRLREEGKVDDKTVESVSQRADVISYAILAEMNHFQNERLNDARQMMKNFITAQISFYQNIANKLQEGLQLYN